MLTAFFIASVLLAVTPASIGLAALFAVSSIAFAIVKFAGALYLPPGAWPVFRDGFLIALLNPKTALFFAAFLPQFIDSATAPMLRSVLLGKLFVLVAATTDSVYVLAASRVTSVLARRRPAGGRPAGSRAGSPRGVGRYLTASPFFGLGIYTLLSGARASE